MSVQTDPSRFCMPLLCAVLWLTTILTPSVIAQPPPDAGPLDGVLLGKWTYRSFPNNSTPGTPVEKLLFSEGTMSITSARDGKLTGTFDFGPGSSMAITGSVSYGNPATLQFEAKGVDPGNKDWLYDCSAYLSFQFPQAVDQKLSIVGTIVRAQAHSGGAAPAGATASWIAVKKDGTELKPLAMVVPMASEKLLKAPAKTPAAMPFKRNGVKIGKQYLDDAERRAANPLAEPERKVLTGSEGGKPKALALAAPGPQPATKASLTPDTVTSEKGVLKLDLVIDYNKTQMIGKDAVSLRTYNGKLVGPVMRAKAGDTLSITVHNNLPDVPPPSPVFMNGHHDWNVTNLHFHGLHVAPEGTPDAESDNVLIEILPGKSQHYEVKIPKDHPAGTFWYHCHRHGSTAAQVASGMAGALIIDSSDSSDHANNLDSIPEVAAAAQEIMVLQACPYQMPAGAKEGDKGKIELTNNPDGTTSADDMFGPGQWFKLQRYITVNGLTIPTITIAPGEVRRLRIVASGQREMVQMRIAKDGDGTLPDADKQIFFHEVATDGLVTGRLTQSPDLIVEPGYRSDALIQAPAGAEGTYYLVDMNTVTSTKAQFNGQVPMGADGTQEPVSIIAKIVVAGAPMKMRLPDPAKLLSQRLEDLKDSGTLRTRNAFYGIVVCPDAPGTNYFLTDEFVPAGKVPLGREYNPTEDRNLPLGQVEKWQVGSRNTGQIPAAHPFHIHINPFLITEVKDACGNDVLQQEFGGTLWRDTLAMKQGYTYTLLTEYKDFKGSFVNHCHILDHEDNGMMEKVTVYDPALPPKAAPMSTAQPGGAWERLEFLKPKAGKPMLAIAVRSVDCGLCRDQIKAFEKAAGSKGWPKDLDLVFVAPDSAARIKAALAEGIIKKGRLVADPKNTLLSYIDPMALTEKRGHGILILDRKGNPIFKSASMEPILDPNALIPHLEALVAQQ